MNDDRRCTATANSTGTRCKRAAVRGATVCATHGGRAPQVRAAAGRRLEQAAAAAEWERAYGALAAQDGTQPSDPSVVVLGEIRWTAAHVEWLRDKVQALPADELVFGVTKSTLKRPATEDRQGRQVAGPATAELTREAKPHQWLVLYGQERDRLVRQCELAHRMGIEERVVSLQQEHGSLLAQVLRSVIGDAELGLDGEQQDRARVVAARHLRLLAGGAA
jgi:hypothetical protein